MDSPRTLVSHCMTANPLTLSPEENLLKALETVRLRGVRRLPVVSGGHGVAILTDNDLVHALVDHLRGVKPGEKD